jgi:multidrug efflux pump
VLTLYTTPVIYIFFDRLAQRFSKNKAEERAGSGGPNAQPENA